MCGYAARERTRLKLTLHGKTPEQQREDLDITLAEIAAHEAACQRMLARTPAATDGKRPAPAQSGVAKASRIRPASRKRWPLHPENVACVHPGHREVLRRQPSPRLGPLAEGHGLDVYVNVSTRYHPLFGRRLE